MREKLGQGWDKCAGEVRSRVEERVGTEERRSGRSRRRRRGGGEE